MHAREPVAGVRYRTVFVAAVGFLGYGQHDTNPFGRVLREWTRRESRHQIRRVDAVYKYWRRRETRLSADEERSRRLLECGGTIREGWALCGLVEPKGYHYTLVGIVVPATNMRGEVRRRPASAPLRAASCGPAEIVAIELRRLEIGNPVAVAVDPHSKIEPVLQPLKALAFAAAVPKRVCEQARNHRSGWKISDNSTCIHGLAAECN